MENFFKGFEKRAAIKSTVPNVIKNTMNTLSKTNLNIIKPPKMPKPSMVSSSMKL